MNSKLINNFLSQCNKIGEKGPLFNLCRFEVIKKQNVNHDSHSFIFFIIEGEIKLSYNGNDEIQLTPNRIGLIPSHSRLSIEVVEPGWAITCGFIMNIQLTDQFRLDELLPYVTCKKEGIHTLQINKCLKKYIDLLYNYLLDGINSPSFLELKKQELFYLLVNYYPHKELASFFYPFISKDLLFRDLVLKSFHLSRTVEELARRTNYSVSGFKQKFVKCFEESPYQWMQKHKATFILKDLKDQKKSLQEIVTEYDFSSSSRLNEFCRRWFGNTPGKVRENLLAENKMPTKTQ